MRVALQRLKRSGSDQGVVDAFMEWLLGLRVLNRHRDLLGVQFRLDTVELKTQALRDLVFVSSEIGILNGIFLLLDELEKQDGVLSATLVVRYLSAIRAIIDALPNHLFMMIAITPDLLRRYSLALPAFRSRLQDKITLSPLTDVNEALSLATFYMDEAKAAAEHEKKTDAPKRRILSVDAIRKTFDEGNLRGQKAWRWRLAPTRVSSRFAPRGGKSNTERRIAGTAWQSYPSRGRGAGAKGGIRRVSMAGADDFEGVKARNRNQVRALGRGKHCGA